MKRMRIEALCRRPRTTKPEPGHKIYPYLLRGTEITRPNQVWAMDITYIPMERGFVYLAVVLDWATRRVLSWRLAHELEAIIAWRGRRVMCVCDNGTELTGMAILTGAMRCGSTDTMSRQESPRRAPSLKAPCIDGGDGSGAFMYTACRCDDNLAVGRDGARYSTIDNRRAPELQARSAERYRIHRGSCPASQTSSAAVLSLKRRKVRRPSVGAASKPRYFGAPV
ncbi:hypothetical protein ABIB68_007402 [Bradyrhizobium sp. F1.2.2]